GPRLSIGDVVQDVPGPLALLTWIPGFDAMRVPARFRMLASFGAALVAGVAVGSLCRRIAGSAGRALLAGALGLVVLLDTRVLREPLPLMAVERPADTPPVYAWLAAETPPDAAVLELPYGDWG